MIHRLGSQRWRRLHRLVYIAAVGGVLHFLWLVKADISRPLLAMAILVLLLTARLGRVPKPVPQPEHDRGVAARPQHAPSSRRAA
jgi:sulfoxide reductase heme-binding subunit YedZ